jgi:chaperonin GroEL
MKKCIIDNNLNSIINGINQSVNVIKSTMGAQGKVVLIEDGLNPIRFTKDGVSVASLIHLNDPIENMGSEIVKSAARQTVELVGDGTTCTSLFLQGFVNEFFKHMNNNEDINEMFSLTQNAIETFMKSSYENALKVTTNKHLYSIASISANSQKLGKMLADVFKQTGEDNLVTLELGSSDTTYYEIKRGIQLKTGYVHEGFSNTNSKQFLASNPLTVIVNDVVNMPEKFQSLMEVSLKTARPLVIFAKDFSQEFIRTIITNKKVGLSACLVKIPGYGRYQVEYMKDLKAYMVNTPENPNIYTCERLVVGPIQTNIYNENNEEGIALRIRELKAMSEHALDNYEKRDFANRIHMLQGSAAIIFAGGVTPEAAKEEYDRIEDALGAIKAALQYGYVGGGGIYLYDYQNKMKPKNIGESILKEVLKMPAKQILINANVNPDITLHQFKYPLGYNVRNHKKENFVDVGIIDPIEVLIQALKNSFATAKLVISTSNVIKISYENNRIF